jgi:hypothetical protein
VAYGYLCVEDADEAEVASLRKEIGACCVREGLRLVTVFCDRGVNPATMARGGFTGLLDVLALPDSTTLVVPDLNYVSPQAAVREGLLRQVKRTGCSVLVIRELNGTFDDLGVTAHGVWIGDDDKDSEAP